MRKYLLAGLFAVGILGIAHAVNLTGTNNSSESQVLKGGFFRMSDANAITALAGGAQLNATPLVNGYNRIVTVASANDSVLLPPCVNGVAGDVGAGGYGNTNGMFVIVTNSHATNAVNVFAQGSVQSINAIAGGTQFSLAATKTAMFICSAAGIWHTLPTIP